MRFEYWKGQDGKWYWHLKAANDEIIAYGESRTHKADVVHVISLVKESSHAPANNLTPRLF